MAFKKSYTVLMEEVWIQKVEVMARGKAEARRAVANGDGTFVNGHGVPCDGFQFSHSTNKKRWEVKTTGKWWVTS